MSDRFVLLYHPGYPIDQIRPMMTLHRLLYLCNYTIHRSEQDLDPGAASELPRLLRVNFLYNELQRGPARIIKPLLLHVQGFNLVTSQGDTRLMAAGLCGTIHTAPCLVSIERQYRGFFVDWIEVEDIQHLAALSGFDADCIVIRRETRSPANYDVEWIEFAGDHTSHHLHDRQERARMMQRYLAAQPRDFQFDIAWCQSSIDWRQWAT